MSKNYQMPSSRAAESPLVVPEAVTVGLGEIVESAKEGLPALAVGAGLQVMSALMEADVTALAGPGAGTTRTAGRCGTAGSAGR